MAMANEINLTPNEKQVLLALDKSGEAVTPEILAEKTKLSMEAAVQGAFLLAEKGLVSVKEEVRTSYSLTHEGLEYAQSGLPERLLINAALKGLSKLDELKKKYPPEKFGIALGWLRRKGWAKIEKDSIVPTGTAAVGEDEQIISMLKEGRPIIHSSSGRTVQAIQDLLKRKLIDVREEKIRTFAITGAGRELVSKGISIEEEIAQLTTRIIKSGEWKTKKLRPYNIHILPEPMRCAKIHPYQRLIEEMRQIFLTMGFTEIRGDIVQSSFWNFDALFQPQDHPAREMQDTFHLDSESELPPIYEKVKQMHETGGGIGSTGWGGTWREDIARKNVLRTHTTAITIKYLADNPKPPVKAFCIDRAYRREAIDPTHTPEFEQLEGVVMDEGVSFKNLLGMLREFYHRMGFENVRFRPGYFPYTEPSIEPEVYIESRGKWIELGGAGIFRKEVTEPLGIDCPVLAWGLGVSRVAMLKLGLKDLRELYQSDIEWLWNSPICRNKENRYGKA